MIPGQPISPASSAVSAPQLGNCRAPRGAAWVPDVYPSPALPTFWARASSSAWISNSPSSESLLRTGTPHPGASEPLLLLPLGQEARTAGRLPGVLAAAGLGAGKWSGAEPIGTYQQRGGARGRLHAAPAAFLLLLLASRGLIHIHTHTPRWRGRYPSEALGNSRGRPESGALTHPRGVNGSGRPAPSCHSRVV